MTHQIDLHNQIDHFLESDPSNTKTEVLCGILGKNSDVKEYFYANANEQWLNWLWQNGFLEVIKTKPTDTSSYTYRTPELLYLARIASTVPSKVVDILHAVPVGPETFNPEVVDQFLRICGELPASELIRVVNGRSILKKIRDEKWVVLMQGFNRWGFDYQAIMKTLAEAQEWQSLMVVAEAILVTRPSEEARRSEYGLLLNSPFYFENFSHTEVFELLAEVGTEYQEEALKLLITVANEVIHFHAKGDDSTTIFAVRDGIHLLELDFFNLTPGEGRHISERDDIRQLLATIKELAERVLYRDDSTPTQVKEMYTSTLGQLLDTSTANKLRLYIWSLRPDIFKNELKAAFLRLFACKDSYYDILSGTEYLKALKKTFFDVFTIEEQASYAENVIAYFTKKQTDNPTENWHRGYAGRIFSVISAYVEAHPELAERIATLKFTIIPEYTPEPSIMGGRSGTVTPQGPISTDEFARLNIKDIAVKFRTEWTPEELKKHDVEDDFLRPLNGEGAGSLLKEDIPKRFAEYIAESESFFEPHILHLHYTYSFFRGIEEVLRANTDVSNISWKPLFATFKAIQDYTIANKVELNRESSGSWLVGWSGVHMAMTDILHGLLRENEGKLQLDFATYRSEIISSIEYLLTYPDPDPEGELLETARMTVLDPQDRQKLVGDPYSIAINSVRGRAFQALAMFVYIDGKSFKKDANIRLSPDVQIIYDAVLEKEQTRAIFFLYGHYLPTFYFRGAKWTLSHLNTIFPTDPGKYHLYLAAWEGYLSANLFEEIFFDEQVQRLYHRGLNVEKELTRRYYRDPDAGIATHLALATIAYHQKFTFNHPLFVAFWKEVTTKQKGEFVSDVGRLYIASDTDRLTEFLARDPEAREVLRKLWDWVLENCTEPEVFAEFGFWMAIKKDVFEKKWLTEHIRLTLEKSGGDLEWDHGLTQIIEELCDASPEDFLSIARSYLLDGAITKGRFMRPMRYDRQWFSVFTKLYNNPKTQAATLELINELIEKGGSDYWELKKVIT